MPAREKRSNKSGGGFVDWFVIWQSMLHSWVFNYLLITFWENRLQSITQRQTSKQRKDTVRPAEVNTPKRYTDPADGGNPVLTTGVRAEGEKRWQLLIRRSEPGEAREVRYRIKRSKINECLSLSASRVGVPQGRGAAAINKTVWQSQPPQQEAATASHNTLVSDLYFFFSLHSRKRKTQSYKFYIYSVGHLLGVETCKRSDLSLFSRQTRTLHFWDAVTSRFCHRIEMTPLIPRELRLDCRHFSQCQTTKRCQKWQRNTTAHQKTQRLRTVEKKKEKGAAGTLRKEKLKVLHWCLFLYTAAELYLTPMLYKLIL